MKLKILIFFCVVAVCQVQCQVPFLLPAATPAPIVDNNNVAFFAKTNRDSPLCSGAVILPNWIITTASCLNKLTPAQVRFQIGTPTVGPASGDPPLPLFNDANLIKTIYLHPSYSEASLANDIALVETADLPKSTVPYDIAGTTNENWVGKSFYMRGYGATASGTPQRGTLTLNQQPVETELNSECRRIVPTMPLNKLCAIGNRICKGDQGGPLVLQNTNELVGLISTDSAIQNTCGVHYYRPAETFTNIMLYKSWISKVTKTKIY